MHPKGAKSGQAGAGRPAPACPPRPATVEPWTQAEASPRPTAAGGRPRPRCGPSTSRTSRGPRGTRCSRCWTSDRGTALLDVACGSGEFAALAHARGAVVHGIDAAEAMIELAKAAVPGADLRVGTLERLPSSDAAFDVVTGFNAFQRASDIVDAFVEAGARQRPAAASRLATGAAWARRISSRSPMTCRHSPWTRRSCPVVRSAIPAFWRGCSRRRACGRRRRAMSPCRTPHQTSTPSNAACSRRATCGTSRSIWARNSASAALAEAAAPFRLPDGSYLFRSTFRWVVADRD